ncbi:protein kinase [Candidatus Woesearchaeota archaeon]|nr:protein kinase [Candidatus Woesearchaeota archaeon]
MVARKPVEQGFEHGAASSASGKPEHGSGIRLVGDEVKCRSKTLDLRKKSPENGASAPSDFCEYDRETGAVAEYENRYYPKEHTAVAYPELFLRDQDRGIDGLVEFETLMMVRERETGSIGFIPYRQRPDPAVHDTGDDSLESLDSIPAWKVLSAYYASKGVSIKRHDSDKDGAMALTYEGRYVVDGKSPDCGLAGRDPATVLFVKGMENDADVHTKLFDEGVILGAVGDVDGSPSLTHVAEIFRPGGETVSTIAMSALEGRTLYDHISGKAAELTAKEKCLVLAQVAEQLDQYHRRAIAHLDVKPSNILVSGRGESIRASIIDTGISDFFLGPSGECSRFRDDLLRGTLEYMAPEQIPDHFVGKEDAGARHANEKTDVFSLAATAYDVFTGSTPATGVLDIYQATGSVLSPLCLIDLELSLKKERFGSRPPAHVEHDVRKVRGVKSMLREGIRYDPAERPAMGEMARGFRSAADQNTGLLDKVKAYTSGIASRLKSGIARGYSTLYRRGADSEERKAA